MFIGSNDLIPQKFAAEAPELNILQIQPALKAIKGTIDETPDPIINMAFATLALSTEKMKVVYHQNEPDKAYWVLEFIRVHVNTVGAA